MSPPAAYAELHCLSNFSFLRGASHPEELVATAARLGYRALALTDECSLAGAVRAHVAAREHGLQLILGSECHLEEGPSLVLLAADETGYGNLCELITRGRRRAEKGGYQLSRADLAEGLPGCLALLLPGEGDLQAQARWLAGTFPGRAWLALELLRDGDDRRRLQALQVAAAVVGLPLVAAGDVHMHCRSRQRLQDTVTAIRLGTTVTAAGQALYANAERYLRSRQALARLYPPEALAETLRIAEHCRFSLERLRYAYPEELVPAGETPASYLRRLALDGMRRRWPEGAPPRVAEQVEQELALIADMGYEPYFLTVHDLVAFARGRGILCQGRGSAANSTVCYCLGITEVDPARMSLLFERFISRERGEPPDIDVDFEHERREEVIQYVYAKYGRHRAALAATVITYRARSAVRDVGKALGLDAGQLERLSSGVAWWDGQGIRPERLQEAGLDPANPLVHRLLSLANQLIGFPRHLSQHVGGFVIADHALARLVPIENAAMAERTVIQWDKDDLAAMGLLKVDVLALGMLSAIRRALDLIRGYSGRQLALADIPAEDPATYDMIDRADTMGVFQIESRAQMAMLPRLRPRCYYDLVIQVAIIRPGPIQGDMVHPYLRRRQGLEPVEYPNEAMHRVLGRTLGVPIFQEQVMQLAIVAAGFTPGEADQLRRAMAAWRRHGHLQRFEHRLIEGMHRRGYTEGFARQIYRQILGFGEYGFPESHAASFALLAYVSAWLKRHEPEALTAALLNSQPMGFYAPAQLVQDARRHGVRVEAVDVRASAWDCTLEPRAGGRPALRLGLRMVKGLSRAGAARLVAARGQAAFTSVFDLARRAELARGDLEALAAADALSGLGDTREGLHRHGARWAVAGVEPDLPLLPGGESEDIPSVLSPPREGESIVADYASLGLSLRRHPLALLRGHLGRLGLSPTAAVSRVGHGVRTHTGGLVIARQRPGTPTGVVFLTIEDETGQLNIIVWGHLVDRYRRVVLAGRLIGVTGEVQREGEVIHVIAHHLSDHTPLLGRLPTRSRDFG